MKKNLSNCISETTSYIIKDRPWRFKQKTQCKYWIEKNKRGMRFVYKTLNPKTDKWCADKKGIYYDFILMFLDENEEVKWVEYGINSSEKWKEKFKQVYLEILNEEEKNKIKEMDYLSEKLNKAFKLAEENINERARKRDSYEGINRFDYLESLGFTLKTSIWLGEFATHEEIKGTRKNSGTSLYYSKHYAKKSDIESMSKEQKEEYKKICILDYCV
jgi:hypothetical protein